MRSITTLKPQISNRPNDVHTIEQVSKIYRNKNIREEYIEFGISKRINTLTKVFSYRVKVWRNGVEYRKSYRSLEQARIFRNTIIKHFSK